MTRRTVVASSCCVWLVVAGLMASSAGAQDAKYVGAKKCKMCHSKPKIGGLAYLKWEKAKHAEAFKTLAGDKAKKMAADKGVADATKDEKCVKCHVTSLKNKSHDEGVGCERCHGAGSNFAKAKVMKDRAAAVKAGLAPLKGASDEETKKNAEKLCRECHGLAHKEESPTAKEFKFDESWKKLDHTHAELKKNPPK